MKKNLIVCLCILVGLSAKAQNDKLKINDLQKKNLFFKDSLMIKKFATGTIGNFLQKNSKGYNALTDDQKKEAQQYFTMDYRTLDLKLANSYRLPTWWSCMINPASCMTITKNNFANFHPCAIAISKQGKVAVSTFEGDYNTGQIFVWNSFADFNANKNFNYCGSIVDPEGIAFDNNERLFIASTTGGKIYYASSLGQLATLALRPSIDLADASNMNPRALAFDNNNNLYVMCENLYNSSIKSRVVKITDPTSTNPSKSNLPGSDQAQENALGLCIYNNNLFTTDYFSNNITQYNLSAAGVTTAKKLEQAGGTLDVASDGTYAFFTNDAGLLIKWTLSNNNTQNVTIGTKDVVFVNQNDPSKKDNVKLVPWGVAVYGNNLLVADAAHNAVKVFDKNNAGWKD